MGILPFVIRHGRTKYAEWTASRSSVHPSGGQSESARLLRNSDRTASYATQNSTLSGSIAGDDDEGPDGSERFDLYFAAASFTVDAIALVGVGSSRAVWQLYACALPLFHPRVLLPVIIPRDLCLQPMRVPHSHGPAGHLCRRRAVRPVHLNSNRSKSSDRSGLEVSGFNTLVPDRRGTTSGGNRAQVPKDLADMGTSLPFTAPSLSSIMPGRCSALSFSVPSILQPRGPCRVSRGS